MNLRGTQLADVQHPWIGLESFTEDNREFFAGRGEEIEDLLRLVRRESLTLLYGVSGLGKTSLLQAGLFPALRAERCLPLRIRLDYPDEDTPLAAQVLGAIAAAAAAAQVEAPEPQPGETLWEYFHREGSHFWSARNDLLTPVVVFDQFEEFFTLGRENTGRAARAAAFIRELADLVENRPSPLLRDVPERAREFSFKPVPLKVLITMREDYLAELDRIRPHFRALGQNHLRLLPMDGKQAGKVIALGTPLLAPGVDERILHFVAGGTAGTGGEITVAPALLSLLLRELNERRLARGPDARITPDLLDIEQGKIFEDFYLRSVRDFPEGVRVFIEDELLTTSGYRNSCALDDALTRPDVTLPILNELVDRRLLAYEDSHHTRRVELTHDVLIPVIKASRDTRLTREAQAQAGRLRAQRAAERRKQKITMAVACALAVALVATIWGGYYAFVQEHRTYYREFAKKRGFPVGLMRISEAEASQLPVSLRFVHKGIAREGWKLRWKPAFRIEAVNGMLELTTNHAIGTYLWRGDAESQGPQDYKPLEKGERLGLRTICQWEFVATGKGEILYERALDRHGRMMTGLIYSPPGSGPAGTRLARFVGPDGFPQMQRSSSAEYVLIHYNKDGWEDLITYRDGKNQSAAGPDGAFGQSMSYNERGQKTRMLSLDADRKPMIDHAGNCGREVSYDKNGRVVQETSLGTDLKATPQKAGIVTAKSQYDAVGRISHLSFHGLEGEPALHAEGYHGYELQYDGRGNETSRTFLGPDGAPTKLAAGYAIMRATYDSHGWLTRLSYHDTDGKPVLYSGDFHAWEAQYDTHGRYTTMTYLHLDGKPTLLRYGYATIRREYEDHGWVTRESYHGINGDAVSTSQGYHGYTSQYDAAGNAIALTYLGLDGKPAALPSGYALIRRKYDSDGNEIESSYFDAAEKPVLTQADGVHRFVRTYDSRGKLTRQNYYGVAGEPTLHKEGNHGLAMTYDERGNEIERTFFGLDGKPALLPNRYATRKCAYDPRGRLLRLNYYGIAGEPVLHKDGYQGLEKTYDERGNDVQTYLGMEGTPIFLGEGFATMKKIYDERGRLKRETYYGPNGEPVLHKDGNHGVEKSYDERGYEIARTYLGLEGTPILLGEGFATMKKVYDEQGRLTRETYYGLAGEPLLHKNGNHGLAMGYDERGNLIERTNLGLDGKPVLLGDGYATLKTTYDPRGKISGLSMYGVNGEPVANKQGRHRMEVRYDERGNKVGETFFGLDGKPQQ